MKNHQQKFYYQMNISPFINHNEFVFTHALMNSNHSPQSATACLTVVM
jgi:hypothetical protein